MNDIEFKLRLNEYLRDTSREEILEDMRKAKPISVPPQVNHEDLGYFHTGLYRAPGAWDHYQSWGQQKPKRIESETGYGSDQCRWILTRIKGNVQ